MIQQERMPGRFGAHASVIQLLALFITSTVMDRHTTLNACTLASLLFWIGAVSLHWWHRNRASQMDLLFLRWGLLAFVLIGTPLFRPIIEWGEWLELILIPSMAVQLVASLLYIVTRVFRLRSPFDGEPPPPEL